MARILRTSLAAEDLTVIGEFIANDKPVAASATLRKLDQAFQVLAENPLLGERQPRFGPELRRFVVGSYLIFYEPLDDGIVLVRVFHGSQRYEDQL